MPKQPCPITGAFLKEVGLRMQEQPSLYDDLLDDYDELVEMASESYPDVGSLNLRGLYIIEHMYYQLLPSIWQPAYGFDFNAMREKRFPRSVQGMRRLVEYIDELREDTEVANYAHELSGLREEGISTWLRSQGTKWSVLLTTITYAAAKVEMALRGVGARYDRIGTDYGICCARVGVEVEMCLDVARLLLRINLENGPSPWNL